MARIIINTANPFYQKVTANGGVAGLGVGWTRFASDSTKMVMDDAILRDKLSKFQELKSTFENATGATLNSWDDRYGYSRDEDSVIYYLEDRITDILYPPGSVLPPTTPPLPPVIIGSRRRRWAENWFREYNTSTSYNVFSGDSRFDSRDIGIVVLTDWVKLLNDILDITSGLAEQEQFDTVLGLDINSTVTGANYGSINVNIVPFNIPITNAILSSFIGLTQLKTLQFFDENREYKTVLTFDDKQYLLEAWRAVPSDTASIQVKLTAPADRNIQGDNIYGRIAREFANPIIDTILIEPTPAIDNTPYLRPPNFDVGKYSANREEINNATLESLKLLTGSIGFISGNLLSYDDKVFNKWMTSDFNASELNIDFSDYANFVFFGSAKQRLEAFKQKLWKIESLSISASLSSSNTAERIRLIEAENIKRNFDLYEQFLYFSSQSSAYSASAYYVDGGIEYNPTGSWPKQSNGKPQSFNNVTDWYLVQSQIAERYDEFNENYLIKHLPEHIQEDTDSSDFLQFIKMFGHIMDNIKIYIDQFPYIYSPSLNPFDELSMDQVYEVATSFGLSLPNAYALENLQDFISNVYGEQDSRFTTAETWKRLLHSAILFMKAKGTRTSLDILLNSYGLSSPSLQIKESSYPTYDDYIKSDEYVYALRFASQSNNLIKVPFVSSSITASTAQIRFIPEVRKRTSLLTGDNLWAIDIVPHPSTSLLTYNIEYVKGKPVQVVKESKTIEYGKIEVISGSSRVVIASSSYFPLFSEDYTHIMLRSQSKDLTIIQTDGDQILFQESASVDLGIMWNATKFLDIGGSGSIKFENFDGFVDDVRIWKESTTSDNFIKQAYDPGSYYGNYYTSSYTSLVVDLSFSIPTSSITQYAINETPSVSSSVITPLLAYNFTTQSYSQIMRTIKQFVPTVGATAYSNKKVTVAPPPVFDSKYVYSDGSYILSRTNSIKSIEDKIYTGGQDIIWFAISPTDFINQTIMRSMGLIDTNYLIGSPRKQKGSRYTEVDELLNFYLKYYDEDINLNEYIRFFKNMFKGPMEYAQTLTPAKAELLDGIVIESPILDRTRIPLLKAFRVDGANTVAFDNYVAGSGSLSGSGNIGAYQFDANYDVFLSNDYTTITKDIYQYANEREVGTTGSQYIVTSSLSSRNSAFSTIVAGIDVLLTTGPVSSTPSSSIPENRYFLQNIQDSPFPSSSVISSIADKGSAVAFISAEIDAESRDAEPYTGYSRNAYLGIANRLDGETNTINPFYAIPPATDFTDVGTTTYFYNNQGIYWFNPATYTSNRRASSQTEPIVNSTKQLFLAKIKSPGEVVSAVSDASVRVSLLNPNTLADYPGRSITTIKARTYASGSNYFGIAKVSRIFSLYYIEGAAGLRIRLYKNVEQQASDVDRPFTFIPTLSAGVLFDAVLEDQQNSITGPTVIENTDALIYFTITNTTNNDILTDMHWYYFEYQPADLIPRGYLSRHYKFNRKDGIALKRRNYLGCKLVFCPEGCTDDVLKTRTFVGKTKFIQTTTIESESPVTVYTAGRTSPVVSGRTGGGTSTGFVPSAGQLSPIDQVLNIANKGKLDDKKK